MLKASNIAPNKSQHLRASVRGRRCAPPVCSALGQKSIVLLAGKATSVFYRSVVFSKVSQSLFAAIAEQQLGARFSLLVRYVKITSSNSGAACILHWVAVVQA
ncbi:hypothetical protein HDN1F_29950 [gamma proteobacterium HdN1]|nr:hypothetical protein HDN1F_29950 [gamma proteobacterium HdN1]